MQRRRNIVTAAALVFAIGLLFTPHSTAIAGPLLRQDAIAATPTVSPPWRWPVNESRAVTEPFRAPSHTYGPGHRGMDIAAQVGNPVHSPADGVVAFRGVVVDRPLVTITHADGLISTLEPVEASVRAGDVVRAGDLVGVVAVGGHSKAGTLHIGARWNSAYVNPLPLFGEIPRAILLPCCSALPHAAPP